MRRMVHFVGWCTLSIPGCPSCPGYEWLFSVPLVTAKLHCSFQHVPVLVLTSTHILSLFLCSTVPCRNPLARWLLTSLSRVLVLLALVHLPHLLASLFVFSQWSCCLAYCHNDPFLSLMCFSIWKRNKLRKIQYVGHYCSFRPSDEATHARDNR